MTSFTTGLPAQATPARSPLRRAADWWAGRGNAADFGRLGRRDLRDIGLTELQIHRARGLRSAQDAAVALHRSALGHRLRR